MVSARAQVELWPRDNRVCHCDVHPIWPQPSPSHPATDLHGCGTSLALLWPVSWCSEQGFCRGLHRHHGFQARGENLFMMFFNENVIITLKWLSYKLSVLYQEMETIISIYF